MGLSRVLWDCTRTPSLTRTIDLELISACPSNKISLVLSCCHDAETLTS